MVPSYIAKHLKIKPDGCCILLGIPSYRKKNANDHSQMILHLPQQNETVQQYTNGSLPGILRDEGSENYLPSDPPKSSTFNLPLFWAAIHINPDNRGKEYCTSLKITESLSYGDKPFLTINKEFFTFSRMICESYPVLLITASFQLEKFPYQPYLRPVKNFITREGNTFLIVFFSISLLNSLFI